MENLPPEIKANILVRLPIKTLCQFKCVSKPFRALITTHHFTKALHNQSSSAAAAQQLLFATTSLYTLNINSSIFRPPEKLQITAAPIADAIQVVGSCHGLLCLRYSPNTFALLNPTTREFRTLPDPGISPPDARLTLSGFGYVKFSDDYMVIRISTDNTGVGESVVRVYSAKADSWNTVRVSVPFRVLTWVKPVYVNGVVHWLGFGGKYPPVHKIMGFDFVDQKFTILPLPENVNQRSIKSLGVLDGCLCVLSRKKDSEASCLEMWKMMEYGVTESWIKTITIATVSNSTSGGNEYLSPICYVKDEVLFRVGCLALQNSHIHLTRITFVLYDPAKRSSTNLEVKLPEMKGILDVGVYEESLVSPYRYVYQDEAGGKQVGRE